MFWAVAYTTGLVEHYPTLATVKRRVRLVPSAGSGGGEGPTVRDPIRHATSADAPRHDSCRVVAYRPTKRVGPEIKGLLVAYPALEPQ